MKIVVAKSTFVKTNDIIVPSSKPVSQRALFLAACTKGSSIIHNWRRSHETLLMQTVCKAVLRADFREIDNTLYVTGSSAPEKNTANPLVIDCDGSALIARVFTVACSTMGQKATITGNEGLRSRPMSPLFRALSDLGVRVTTLSQPDQLPVVVDGLCPGGSVSMRSDISSQFISSMLLSAPRMQLGLSVSVNGTIKSESYILQTLQSLSNAGVKINKLNCEGSWVINVPPTNLAPFECRISGDYTSASYFLAAAMITGSEIVLSRIRQDSLQGESAILTIADKLGARLIWSDDNLSVECHRVGGEIHVDLSDGPNILPTLAVLGVCLEGTMEVVGGEVTNYHKCNRLRCIVDELTSTGAKIELIETNGIAVGFRATGKSLPIKIGALNAREDHRLAKAFALLALATKEPITITGIDTQVPMLANYCDSLAAFGLQAVIHH